MIVAGYGEIGSYTHQAFETLALDDAHYLDCGSFPAACATLAEGRTDRLILPLSNNTVGPIPDAQNALRMHNFQLMQTLDLLIEHALIGCPGATLDTIRSVMSYPTAMEQCCKIITQHNWRKIEHRGTATAIEDMLYQNDISLAAIGPLFIGKDRGGIVLAYPINDNADNTTTFGVFQRKI